MLKLLALYAQGFLCLWTYSAQTFTVLEVLGAAKMNQIEANIRDHQHGNSSVTNVMNTIDLQGGQIAFPATQSASAGANTLDDYEEGTFSPSLGGTTTYITQVGTYTKIGRLVFVQVNMQVNAIGTGSTSLISGLPFANLSSSNETVLAAGWLNASVTSIVFLVGKIQNGASTISLLSATAAQTSLAVNAIMGNNASIHTSGSYHTT